MSYIEIGTTELARMLSIMSEHFGSKPMTVADINLRSKLEAMYKAEKAWEDDKD